MREWKLMTDRCTRRVIEHHHGGVWSYQDSDMEALLAEGFWPSKTCLEHELENVVWEIHCVSDKHPSHSSCLHRFGNWSVLTLYGSSLDQGVGTTLSGTTTHHEL